MNWELLYNVFTIYNFQYFEVLKILESTLTGSNILNIKLKGISFVKNISTQYITYTKPGSVQYLLHGPEPSNQSINIKLGKLGELIAKELVKVALEGIQQKRTLGR